MIEIKVKDFGIMKFELDYENAPNSAANFASLARNGFYDGLTFHRIIKGFMIQGGDGRSKNRFLDYSIKGEFASNGVKNNLKHTRGVISMARTFIPDSATSQFFIVHKDAPHLDGEYAAFGKMLEGFDVLDKIASVRTNRNDVPIDLVEIEYVKAIDEPIKEVVKIQ